jgi:hypothetical protein
MPLLATGDMRLTTRSGLERRMAAAKHTRSLLEFPCLQCAAPVFRWPSKVHNTAQVFCNRACRHAWRREQTLTESLEEALWRRFWKYVTFPQAPHACWLWKGAKGGWPYQYGSWAFQGRTLKPHRVVYDYFYGLTSPALDICHTCDVPLCVKPQHLFEGTAQDNIDDMRRKGRERKRGLPGEENSQAKLTTDIVLRIRAMVEAKEQTCKAIAAQFNISPRHVRDIGRRKTWKHLVFLSE